MTGERITDHVFRRTWPGGRGNTGAGNGKGRAVVPGMCAWNGTCNRPAGAHIGVEEFRRAARRGAR